MAISERPAPIRRVSERLWLLRPWRSDFRWWHKFFFYPSKLRQLLAIISKIKDLHLRGESSKSHPAKAGSKEILNPKPQKRGRI
jgi:hypothetical protein